MKAEFKKDMVKRNEIYIFHGVPNHGSSVKLAPEIAAEIYKMVL